MYPLFEVESSGTYGTVYGHIVPADTGSLREVVELIGKQFKRETRYDFAPFDSSNWDQEGVLFASNRFLATFAIAAGAAGFAQENGTWWMDWIWIHPYERSSGLADRVWEELEARYGKFHIDGPYSNAMAALLRRHGVSPERLNHELPT